LGGGCTPVDKLAPVAFRIACRVKTLAKHKLGQSWPAAERYSCREEDMRDRMLR